MRMSVNKSDESALPLIGVYEISKILGATLDLNKALHEVLNILSAYLNMRHGAVLLNDENGKANLVAVTGMSLQMARSGGIKYPFTAAEKVISTGIPMVAANAADEPLLSEYIAANVALEGEDVSFFCVPIKTTEKAFGALSVERVWDGSPQYTFEHDLRFLTMVATLIGQTAALHRKIANDRSTLMADTTRLQKQMADVGPSLPIQGLEDVVGNSEAMTRVFAQVQQAASTKATILLRGESGTGKELVARAVHILSPRAQKPFIKVNCAALSESVLESELFGHEKGSFTGAVADRKGRFELAHTGTLFLDEIGEISSNFQAKLLRVLQEGEFERVGGTKTVKVDVRLVAATNRDLEKAVSEGSFRSDLYFRLNVVPIFLPPLRERQGDIPLLAMYFLKQFNTENGRKLTFSHNALEALQRCYFPGNVRELENCVYRTATMTRGQVIDQMDLSCNRDTCLSSSLWSKEAQPVVNQRSNPVPVPTGPLVPPQSHSHPHPVAPSVADAPAAQSEAGMPAELGDDASERDRLVQAMEKCGWVQAKAARLLGLTPRQIGYALKKHNIEVRQL
ncbi:nif-specific transcriptional activator NifA [Paramagnetospirillum marisnigri]|uniref:Nif-specific regulatory protein n=2 Tax=Paramagnetospirillum marisnigri TaxID=1285242 RepID=A0A178MA78_9PROT|nr:nif-specific transcriptional activator NifA [Paramagnetospirillum marisnigri]OAN44784.1 nif-specific transcriptional activator NifA [Paramagnetospirillum marisnigri]